MYKCTSSRKCIQPSRRVASRLYVNILHFRDLNKHPKMKHTALVADEMFPEGAGPYMDIEEVCDIISIFPK